jgi:hypothetical protein
MIKIKRSLIALLCIFALVSLAVFVTPSLSQGQGQGNQSQLNVNVVNTPLPVRDIHNSTLQPYELATSFVLEATSGPLVYDDNPVPPSKRLILDYTSAQCIAPTGERVAIAIRQATPAGNASFNLRSIVFPVMNFQGSNFASNSDSYHASDQLRGYVPADGFVQISIMRTGIVVGEVRCDFYLSGYYVDVQ